MLERFDTTAQRAKIKAAVAECIRTERAGGESAML